MFRLERLGIEIILWDWREQEWGVFFPSMVTILLSHFRLIFVAFERGKSPISHGYKIWSKRARGLEAITRGP